MNIFWNWVVEINKLLWSGCLCVSVCDFSVWKFACVCMRGVNVTCNLVSILAVCILWREALEQKSSHRLTVLCLEATYTLSISIKASMLHHCLHALTANHGSFMANNKITCMNLEWNGKMFLRKEDMGIVTWNPFIFLWAFLAKCYTSHAEARCMFITAILLMNNTDTFFLFHGVTVWCFLSCERLLWVWAE